MGLYTDLNHIKPFFSTEEVSLSRDKVNLMLNSLLNRTGKGSEWLGWLDLLEEPNDALINQIDDHASQIRKDADVFIVVGIGGSYLGAKAVIDALSSSFEKNKPEIIYAGHHMGDRYHKELLDYLSKPLSDGRQKSVYVNVISKSGTTLEPALAFRQLRSWMKKTYGDEASQRIIATTSEQGGALNKIIEAEKYQKYIIPDTVGGRFSVLTPVGLLPIAVAGIDIQSLFYGAVDQLLMIKKDPSHIVEHAALRFAAHNKGYAIDLFASFDPELGSFGGWIQQLLGESEGKNHKGIFPAVLRYSTDLHSLGQMVQDGRRNMIETFITVKKINEQLLVKPELNDEDGLNYLSGRSFHEINAIALDGTRQAHIDGGIPVIDMHVDVLDANHLGKLILYFEVLTGAYVYCLEENPFDQPGVEAYKKAMFRLLGKP
jgi:glucose-6-phosphate isomerase